jgi:hypothetical protein
MPAPSFFHRPRESRLAATGAGHHGNLWPEALSIGLPTLIPLRSSLSVWLWKTCLLLASGLCVAASAAAQDPAAAPAAVAANGAPPSLSTRIPGLFEIELPKTERRGTIRFTFQPSFRDLLSKPYLRVPLEFRWGVNDHFELNSEMDTYFDHGLRSGQSNGYGISELHFGAKYAWLKWLKPTWDASVGVDTSFPVSRPPIELTDGRNHFTPYIVFGRKLGWWPGLSGFLHTSVDLISKSSTPGNFGRNQPHGNSLKLTPGFLYDRKAWHYTLEVDGTTTSVIGKGNQDFLTIRPGVVWDLPKKLVFNAHGRWLAGFSVTAVFGPEGNTLSTGGRFRGEINLMHLFRRNQPADPPGL